MAAIQNRQHNIEKIGFDVFARGAPVNKNEADETNKECKQRFNG
jgi:hypothetical protein